MGFELKGARVLVLGLGETGMSMARWLTAQGARVRVADTRGQPPNAAKLAAELPGTPLDTGAFRRESFADADLIAVSPGVPLAEPLVREALGRGVEVVGDVELFARVRDRACPLIAITGSNGKSTVTAMTGAICEAAGLTTVVAGNIGLPVLDALATPGPQACVLELSSFQLETTRSLDATAATMLNLSEDHLDRYASMHDYAAAKARVFAGEGVQVLNRADPASLGMRIPGRRAVTFGPDAPVDDADWGFVGDPEHRQLARGNEALMPVASLGVAGLHNAANALAACALARAIGVGDAAMVRGLRAFSGLPHRLQKVAEVDGVAFYDDSKGTNVGAAVAALEGLGPGTVLIAGGEGKGQDFSPLAAPVRAHARAVVLIGRDAERIATALADCGVPLARAQTMEEAVRIAHATARPGERVLLSPACASFDMFRNYGHRGEVFTRAVRSLAGRSGGGL